MFGLLVSKSFILFYLFIFFIFFFISSISRGLGNCSIKKENLDRSWPFLSSPTIQRILELFILVILVLEKLNVQRILHADKFLKKNSKYIYIFFAFSLQVSCLIGQSHCVQYCSLFQVRNSVCEGQLKPGLVISWD